MAELPEQAMWALKHMASRGGNAFRKDVLTPYMAKKLATLGLITQGPVSGGLTVVTLTERGKRMAAGVCLNCGRTSQLHIPSGGACMPGFA